MDDCVECSREFARRVSEELGIPVYMYEYAETKGAYRHCFLRSVRESTRPFPREL